VSFCLETARLILRPFAPADWDLLNAVLSDPASTRYMHFASWTEDQRRRWFERCLSSACDAVAAAANWAIVLKDGGRVIGWFGIGASSHPALPGERSFGYLIGRAHWNQGYMTEALRAVLDHEFRTRGTPRVHAACETANPASARVMENAGMRREKTMRDSDFEGNAAERHHYAITLAEYGEAQAAAARARRDAAPPTAL
jgi:[ribosomal protein S5]-alanine N-acetyltransferase